MRSTPGNQTGLSLIELMIASVIGLVILGGAVTIFSSNSASSKLSTGMARVQDNGRVALDICLLYTSPSPRDATLSRMPSSA